MQTNEFLHKATPQDVLSDVIEHQSGKPIVIPNSINVINASLLKKAAIVKDKALNVKGAPVIHLWVRCINAVIVAEYSKGGLFLNPKLKNVQAYEK